MTVADRVVPVSVRAPHGATTLEIGWSTGEHTPIPHWILRGFCPCASCQGHEGPLRYVAETDIQERVAFEIRSLRRVGNYALQFTWGDGHEAGIYPFEQLRWLGSLAALSPEVVRAQRASR
ncbi:MAG: DUF971 domain-containing protein [Polyangiaceae bacterium]|nr:DUF971 domain-containing protein [Polyangiaceae bacterium]